MRHRVGWAAFVLCLWASVASATTYYVRTDGNNANAGTANTAGGAWRTIDYGADHAAAGDTVRVQAGTYVETATPGVSGTSGSTVTLVADGTVTTCGMDFSAKSYIRIVGFTMNPNASSCGGSPSPIVYIHGGTNTGLEFWNNDIGNLGNGNAFGTTVGDSDRCTKCIVFGGSFHDIGANPDAYSVTALNLYGDDNFVGYVNFATICYLGVGPAGSRGRFVNLNFSGFIQCNGGVAHPDFFYIAISTAGFSNNLVESIYGIGTPTSTDNKVFHAENQSAGTWSDNVWRQIVDYNMGSGFLSVYTNPSAIARWRFYNNSTVSCSRANSGAQYIGCGNISAQLGGTSVTASILNNIWYQGWGDSATTNISPWGEENLGSVTVTKNYNLGYSPLGSVSFGSTWTAQANPQSNVNPLFNNAASDFTLQAGSLARGTGGRLTTANGAGTTSTSLTVATGTGSFFIGSNAANLTQYGGALVPGDFIMVGSTAAQVSSVSGDVVTLVSPISWSNGASVYYGTSTTIDPGAYPFKSGGFALSATYTLVGGTAVTITPNDATLVRFAVCYENGIPTTVKNAAPFTCTVASGATLDLRVYPRFASTTPYASASLAGGPAITTTSPLTAATRNAAYVSNTLNATGGTTPYTWAQSGSALGTGACTGLSFTDNGNSTAKVTGTPSVLGICSFSVRVTDAALATDTQPFTITVSAPGSAVAVFGRGIPKQ